MTRPTAAELAAIRERDARYVKHNGKTGRAYLRSGGESERRAVERAILEDGVQSIDDRRALLAEIDALTAQVAALTAERNGARAQLKEAREALEYYAAQFKGHVGNVDRSASPAKRQEHHQACASLIGNLACDCYGGRLDWLSDTAKRQEGEPTSDMSNDYDGADEV